LHALDYPHATAEPQKNGWPLTVEERAYIVDKPEHDRRPGRRVEQASAAALAEVPTAGYFGGDAWLKLHEAHETVQANQGHIDVLLVGDSITIQWGDSWKKHFPDLKAVNIGIGGDKTQNVLWRLDHGGVDGLEPKAVVLMIGNNNMFFTPETSVEAAAKGIEMCLKNLREKFPVAAIIVAKILPAHAPGHRFYEDIKKTNAALDSLKLDNDPKVNVLDLWADFTNADGTIKKDLFTPDNIHLSSAGYAVYAEIEAADRRQYTMKHTATLFAALHLLIALHNPLYAADTPPKKPNVIFILADDLGIGNVGCYGADNYQTPNIDKLAATGIRFTHAFTAALCGPSRALVQTGRYAIPQWIIEPETPAW